MHIRELRGADLDLLFDRRVRVLATGWLERQAAGEVCVAVAELDGVPVARAVLELPMPGGERVGHLRAARVEPAYQSQGIGSALIAHLEELARSRGLVAIELDVEKNNVRARALYERLGYRACGDKVLGWTYPDGDRQVEAVEDCWVMRKTLNGWRTTE